MFLLITFSKYVLSFSKKRGKGGASPKIKEGKKSCVYSSLFISTKYDRIKYPVSVMLNWIILHINGRITMFKKFSVIISTALFIFTLSACSSNVSSVSKQTSKNEINEIPAEVTSFVTNFNTILDEKGSSENTEKLSKDLKIVKEKGYQDKNLHVISLIDHQNIKDGTVELGNMKNFRVILDDKQKEIQKITYLGEDPNVFLISLESLGIYTTKEVKDMLEDIRIKIDRKDPKVESVAYTKKYKVSFTYDSNSPTALLSVLFEKNN